MTDQMTDARALEWVIWIKGRGAMKIPSGVKSLAEYEAALDYIASRIQAQQPEDKLADTQRAIIEAAEARGYRRGIEEAQQPGAQAVVIPEPSEDDVEAAKDAFDDVYDGMPGSDRPSLRAALTTYTARLRQRLK